MPGEKPGRPATTFMDTLKGDTGVTTSAESFTCMYIHKDCSLRCETQLGRADDNDDDVRGYGGLKRR